jgi:HlyD family secretion protein
MGQRLESSRRPRRPSWRKPLLFAALLLAAAGLFAWRALLPAFSSPDSRVFAGAAGTPALMRLLGRPIEVAVVPVEQRQLVQTIAAEGSTAFLNEVPVHSEVPGIVTEILVEAGDRIERGHRLLVLNPGGHVARTFELRRDLRDWELKDSHQRLAREKELLAQNFTSQARFDSEQINAQRARVASQLALEEYASSLRSRSTTVAGDVASLPGRALSQRKIDIVATAGGTVIERHVQGGENLIDVRKPLLMIGDRLVFRAQVDQRYAGAVKRGDKGTLFLRARPGVPIAADVVRVGTEVQTVAERSANSAQALTFPVWVALADAAPKDLHLMAGMNGFVSFERPYVAAAVPESALMRFSGRTGTVLTVDGEGRLAVKIVTYSGAADGWVALEPGEVGAGQQVVLKGQTALKPGDRVIAQLPRAEAPRSVAQRAAAGSVR